MDEFGIAFTEAIAMVIELDNGLVEIVSLSLGVSFTAVFIAALIGLPLGAAAALFRFPGRTFIVVILNAFMGLPPVVVGLIVYILLSRAGPLGVLGLLFTPTAMIIAQVILVTPIIASLTRQVIEDLWQEDEEQMRSLGILKRPKSNYLCFGRAFKGISEKPSRKSPTHSAQTYKKPSFT